jgi:acetyl esterase/lipase
MYLPVYIHPFDTRTDINSLLDPVSHREPCAKISSLTGAPVFSVRYRLAPQNPFPAALVDALTAYLSLIHPPPGSLHKPIAASKIIFAGDSAGGNLSLVLLQTLLTLQRADQSIRFHGNNVPVELPGGIATSSPWCDITRSMPSNFRNAHLDYLDAPPLPVGDTLFNGLPFIPDDVWPVSPPRADVFCNSTILCHPLVAPLAAPAELWKNAPPIFISVGEEGLADEALIVARRLHQAGASVQTELFEGMPHCHALIMMGTPASDRFFGNFSKFCLDAVAGNVKPTGTMNWIEFKMRSTKEIPIEEACGTSDEEARALLQKAVDWRLRTEFELQKGWNAKARL